MMEKTTYSDNNVYMYTTRNFIPPLPHLMFSSDAVPLEVPKPGEKVQFNAFEVCYPYYNTI